jgi:hypothetical protein
VVQPVEHRSAEELLQTGECQLHLGLDTASARDLQFRGPVSNVIEQGRLTDSGLPAHNQH